MKQYNKIVYIQDNYKLDSENNENYIDFGLHSTFGSTFHFIVPTSRIESSEILAKL